MNIVRRVLLGLAMAVLLAPLASAQGPFGISGGPTLHGGGGDTLYTRGYHLAASFSIKPPLSSTGLRFEALFHELPKNSDKALRLQTIAGLLNATFSWPQSPLPSLYLIAGGGIYNTKATDSPPGLTNAWSNDFGVNVGVGANILIPSRFDFFLEARFHAVVGDLVGVHYLPISAGIRF